MDRQEPGIVANLIILVLKENLKGDNDDKDDKSFTYDAYLTQESGWEGT